MSVTVHVRWPGEKEHVQLIPPFLFQKNLNCMHDSEFMIIYENEIHEKGFAAFHGRGRI